MMPHRLYDVIEPEVQASIEELSSHVLPMAIRPEVAMQVAEITVARGIAAGVEAAEVARRARNSDASRYGVGTLRDAGAPSSRCCSSLRFFQLCCQSGVRDYTSLIMTLGILFILLMLRLLYILDNHFLL
jgi:hypothetical protein